MSFIEEYDDLIMSEKTTFQKVCRVLLKQTFLVSDRSEESRKLYFFVRKHQEMFTDYFSYMGYEVIVDLDNKVVMLRNGKYDGVVVNRRRFKKYESIVLCCLWTLYVDQIREGNLARPIMITIFDLRQTMEKYGVKEEMEGKGMLRDTLELFSRYQLISVNGELGSPECQIRLFASLQFALDTEEFKRLAAESDERMRKGKKGKDFYADEPDEDEAAEDETLEDNAEEDENAT